MKKLIILAMFVTLSLGSAIAQVQVDRGYGIHGIETIGQNLPKEENSALAIKYGFKVGMNVSKMSSRMTFDPTFSMGVGYQVGAVINFHWGQRTQSSLPGTGLWGLQPELIFSNQVVNSNGGKIKLNYIKLPVMFKVYPLANLGIEVGPEFSYLVASSPEYVKFDGAVVKVGDCNGLDIGLGVGLAYELNCGLMFGARYSTGFVDLGENLKWKNSNNIQITAGWLF